MSGASVIYVLVESHVRSLKLLGVTSDSYGSLLSTVLLNKLLSELWLIVSREVSEGRLEFRLSLLKGTTREIEERE